MRATEQIIEAIQPLQGTAIDRSIVVALDGHSGAGKSTLAAAVAEAIDAALVHVDDFYRDVPESERLDLTAARGVDRYFDWERLRAEAIMPLAKRGRARYGRFDWVTGHGLTKAITVDPRDVVIVEGVYAARPEFDDLLDLKVLVEVQSATREERRQRRARTVSRDAPEFWDTRWNSAERHYFRTVRQRETFDLVVRGDH
jgi:uridine kinase